MLILNLSYVGILVHYEWRRIFLLPTDLKEWRGNVQSHPVKWQWAFVLCPMVLLPILSPVDKTGYFRRVTAVTCLLGFDFWLCLWQGWQSEEFLALYGPICDPVYDPEAYNFCDYLCYLMLRWIKWSENTVFRNDCLVTGNKVSPCNYLKGYFWNIFSF